MDLIDEKQSATDMFDAQVQLYNHMFKFMNSMSLKCAVQLGIPDIIHNHAKPITLPQLVSSLNIHPDKTTSVYRLMRVMVFSGFFATTKLPTDHHQEQEQEAFVLTPSSNLLLKNNSNSLKPFVLSLLTPDFFTPWHAFGDWFRGDVSTPFEQAHGIPFWEYIAQNHDVSRLFNEAMSSDSRMMNLVIRDCKPIFEGVDSLVDVGGGTGSLGRIVSEAFPNLKYTVLELPQVIANLEGTKNLNFVGGDMFQHIPSADAIILKLILHGWSDEECLKILKKCKEAVSGKGKGGKVMIIDVVINEKKDDRELTETKLFFDLLMMVVVTGKERSEKEFENLFLEAGFSHYKITPLLGLKSLIEVYP